MDRTEKDLPGPGGSQSKISPILFWVIVAAVLFRVVTTVTDKDKKGAGGGEGLVHWQQHGSAQALAARAGKPILYDFTAAWCVPCHKLDKEAWGDDGIAGKVNAGFIPARIVDRQREDGKNEPSVEELQRRYSIQAFPTLVIADASGREIVRSEGFRDKETLVKFLESGLSTPAGTVSVPGP